MSQPSQDSPMSDAVLETEVLVRILARLGEAVLTLPADVVLAPGPVREVPLALPALPEGNLFFLPAPGVVTSLPMLLGRARVERSASGLVLPLTVVAPLAAGSVVGRLEVRSPSEPPEGMRAKVFQSHLLSSIQQARAETAA